jgi:hypothetical protein
VGRKVRLLGEIHLNTLVKARRKPGGQLNSYEFLRNKLIPIEEMPIGAEFIVPNSENRFKVLSHNQKGVQILVTSPEGEEIAVTVDCGQTVEATWFPVIQ